MDESPDTLSRIVNVSKILRHKYKSLKRGYAKTTQDLEKRFTPITQPLKEILKLDKEKFNTPDVKTEPTSLEPLTTTPLPRKKRRRNKNKISLGETPLSDISFETPRASSFDLQTPTQPPAAAEASLTLDKEDVFVDAPLPPAPEVVAPQIDQDKLSDLVGDIAAAYFKFHLVGDDKEKDTVYGVRRNYNNEWMIGNSLINVRHNDLEIKNKWYEGTRGLYELLFMKRPRGYTEIDKNNYTDIVLRTNAHRRGYVAHGQLNGCSSKKYKDVIKPAFTASLHRSQSVSGFGLPKNLIVNNNKYDYVHWDDPNELVDRLRLLMSSKQAGHTGHDNEILSIIEELREAHIIE